jgi:tRNA-(ms[2]io[6]A)-hydroxylase
VLQATDSDDALAASRPRWHWTLIGAGFTATLWAPLAVVAVPLGVRLASASSVAHPVLRGLLVALPAVVAFGLSAAVAGGLVGRFGGRAGPREGALGGALAAFVLALLGRVAGGDLPFIALFSAFLVLAVIGFASGGYGAGLGRRKRPVLGSRAP